MSYEDVEIGKVIKIAGVEWIPLEKRDDMVLCLTKKLIYNHMFDSSTNNYAKSEIRKKLKEFQNKITKAVGDDALVEVDIDLTSDDGLDDYDMVTDKIGLLTCDMYRQYNRIIEKHPVNNWWWLATPFSTPYRGYSFIVRCVRDGGTLGYNDCDYDYGVRPFCIFKSFIF